MEIYENLSIESLPNEEWKDVVGYEGLYQVSNLGRIRSLNRLCKSGRGYVIHKLSGKIMSLKVHKKGYLEVSLSLNGKRRMHKVHRLVAIAFIENPQSLKEVNHKDENTKNNSVENLEWCSSKYNANYGSRNKRTSLARSKAILQYNLNEEVIAEHSSLTSAGKSVNGNAQGIFMSANGIIKKYKGFIWKYK